MLRLRTPKQAWRNLYNKVFSNGHSGLSVIQLETVKGEMKDMFEKLLEKLKELFQLNQPELDFGIYRIMHAKSNEITKFLEQDLLPQVKDALSGYQSVDRARVERELDEAINQAKGLGVDPDSVEKVKALRAQLADAPNAEAVEAEVYEALYKFFRECLDFVGGTNCLMITLCSVYEKMISPRCLSALPCFADHLPFTLDKKA